MLKVGYHYTSLENWSKIQKDGLVSYRINIQTEDLPEEYRYVNGVWIWERKPMGRSHFGTILYQMSKKNTDDVVFLKLKYDTNNLWEYNECIVKTKHRGTIDKYVYHTNEPGVISMYGIPPENIELVRTYNLLEIFNEYEKQQRGAVLLPKRASLD